MIIETKSVEITARQALVIKELKEDLRILERDLFLDDAPVALPSPSVIRAILAPILRKWISDDGLKPLHDIMKLQTVFPALDFVDDVSTCTQENIFFWFGTLRVMGYDVAMISPPQSGKEKTRKDGKLETEIDLRWVEFRNQRVAFHNSHFFTRAECVRYLADQLGGTHTQMQAKKQDRPTKALLELVGFKIEGDLIQVVPLFDSDIDAVKVERPPNFFFLMDLIVLDTARRFYRGTSSVVGTCTEELSFR